MDEVAAFVELFGIVCFCTGVGEAIAEIQICSVSAFTEMKKGIDRQLSFLLVDRYHPKWSRTSKFLYLDARQRQIVPTRTA